MLCNAVSILEQTQNDKGLLHVKYQYYNAEHRYFNAEHRYFNAEHRNFNAEY